MKLEITLDELDAMAVNKAIAARQAQRFDGECILPESESDLSGTILGEICRDWLESRGLWDSVGIRDIIEDAQRQRVRLVDLPGRPGETMAAVVHSAREAIALLLTGEAAVTASGSHGAINAYRGPSGIIHCEFMQRMITVDRSHFPTVGESEDWLETWWPRME